MRSFLFQKADGSFLHFYYDKKNSTLSLQRYTQRGLGQHQVTVLRKNIEPEFCCAADSDGNLHFAFSALPHSIHYGYFTQNTFRSFPILTGKSPMPYPKHLCILAQKNAAAVFYLIRHGEKEILSMQQVDNNEGAFSTPVAIDYLWHQKQNFAACLSQDGKYFLAYSREQAETQSGIHVIRTLEDNGAVLRQQEFLSECKEPLCIDHFSADKENNLTILAHPISYTTLYLYKGAEKGLQSLDLTPYPRSAATFFGLLPLAEGTHCYFCTDGVCYDSMQDKNGQFSSFQKQPDPYRTAVTPIVYLSRERELLLPGTVTGRQFFYFYSPFASKQPQARPTEAALLFQLEKRVSALERQLTRLEKDIKTPRDVVSRNFDT